AINREEFLQELRMLKTVGTYTEIHKGDEEKIKAVYKQELDRELNEDELETITYFVNGYEMVNL
ncbi:MBL fold metallo-hydrolase, partial [Bacillus thuringiensis]|nr:MBL fold metallo-hydrolase [Bacillus thuringiensis]